MIISTQLSSACSKHLQIFRKVFKKFRVITFCVHIGNEHEKCFKRNLNMPILVLWFLSSIDSLWYFLKGAWHEYFEKLILLKLADKVRVHLNISSTMRKLQSCVSFRSNKRKLCLCYSLFYLVWWPHFLISKQQFCWFLLKYLVNPNQISLQRSEKYD